MVKKNQTFRVLNTIYLNTIKIYKNHSSIKILFRPPVRIRDHIRPKRIDYYIQSIRSYYFLLIDQKKGIKPACSRRMSQNQLRKFTSKTQRLKVNCF